MHPAVTLTTLLLVVACGVGAISDVWKQWRGWKKSIVCPVANQPINRQKRYLLGKNGYLEYEISMYFDQALYDKWYNHMTPESKSPETRKNLTIALLKKYYVSLIYAMDIPFKRIKEDRIHMRLVPGTLIIAENEPSFIGDNMNTKALNVSSALFAFRQWLKKTKKTFDHFQLHTGHKFSDGPFSNAFLGTCNDQSVSIISDNNVKDFWMIVKQAVDALGHSLNMKHLGKQSLPHRVMNPKSNMAWTFSASSIEILKKTLSRLDAEKNTCLRNRDHQMKDALPQARLSANEQCRVAFGICSEVCQHDMNKICTGMECCTGYKPDGVVIPLAGTACGGAHSGKICHADACIKHPDDKPSSNPDTQDPQCLAKKAPLEYEISMYFDKALYDEWYDRMTPKSESSDARKKMTITLLKKYFVTLIFEMDVPYEHLKHKKIKMRLVPGTLIIAENEPPFIRDNVHKSILNPTSTLFGFMQWLKDTKQTFDHFQIHTGYKLHGGKRSSAYPSICNSQSVSIVSDDRVSLYPWFSRPAITSIGYRHRYVWNSLNISQKMYSFVMKTSSIGWVFTGSSIKILRSTISRLDREGNDCLRSRDHQMKDALPQTRLSLNEQCRLDVGVDGKVCRYDRRFICQVTECCIGSKRISFVIPLTGTACGDPINSGVDGSKNSKAAMCYWKACVHHEEGPAKIPGCPYGDEKIGCKAPRDCTKSKKQDCCETCANLGNKG